MGNSMEGKLNKNDPDRPQLLTNLIYPASAVWSKQTAPTYISSDNFHEAYYPDGIIQRNLRRTNANTRKAMENVAHNNALSNTQLRYNSFVSGTGTVVPGHREKHLEDSSYLMKQLNEGTMNHQQVNANFTQFALIGLYVVLFIKFMSG